VRNDLPVLIDPEQRFEPETENRESVDVHAVRKVERARAGGEPPVQSLDVAPGRGAVTGRGVLGEGGARGDTGDHRESRYRHHRLLESHGSPFRSRGSALSAEREPGTDSTSRRV